MRRESAAASRVSATALHIQAAARFGTRRRLFSASCAPEIAGLAIFGVLIDLPDIVKLFTGDDVRGGEHAGHHRMVLVVIFVHAVAADEMQIGIGELRARAGSSLD